MYDRILVTGSSGVLGSAFIRIANEYPRSEFVFVRREHCDIRNESAFAQYVAAVNPDAIVHLAALSGGVVLSKEHPASLLTDNVLMTISVLETARKLRIRKAVLTLSSGMYPVDAPNPIREDSIHDGPAHESNYSYAYAKRLIEPAIRAYRMEYGLNAIGLVPNGIFGPGDAFAPDVSTFIAALMVRFLASARDDSKIVVWGDGSPLREVTYSTDMARAFMWCLLNYNSPDILNVGTVEEHSVGEIAFMIADELGINKDRIVFDSGKPGGIQRKSTDNSRFVSLSGFKYTPFRIGLRETLDWLKQNNVSCESNGS